VNALPQWRRRRQVGLPADRRGQNNAKGQIRKQTLDADTGAVPPGEHYGTSPRLIPYSRRAVILDNATAEHNIVGDVAS
jgi:hypothetical protein